MSKILYVGLGGFLGAIIRYLLTYLTSKNLSNPIPLGTLISNILGGFFIGFIISLSIRNHNISYNLKLFLTTGLMGGLTTFSTFSLETITLMEKGSYKLTLINIALNLSLSFLGVFLGENFVSKIF
ncbi:fluoride efflux transporter CrcB [Clostridium oceanicum]|uniref:Fluoride-specific ion channel FluC n=1 Tax=Clostridium oceanicum TaxID=1543 RepID=A0ABN1JH99_9CLOT